MAEAYPYETRDRAEEMYVEQGATYEQIAEALNVARNTLLGWGKAREWKERREEYLGANRTLQASLFKLRQSMIEKAIKSTNPQDVFAVTSLVNAMKAVPSSGSSEPVDYTPVEISTPEDAVDGLQKAIQAKLNSMLANPGTVNLANIRDMKKAMELVDDIRRKYIPEDSKPMKKQLDPETLRIIKEEIYGIA